MSEGRKSKSIRIHVILPKESKNELVERAARVWLGIYDEDWSNL